MACELAAALNVSTGMALHQTHRGLALRDRLPKVAALFAAGMISDLVVRTIVSRTYLIDDHDALTAVDADLADRVTRWGALSVKKNRRRHRRPGRRTRPRRAAPPHPGGCD